MDKSGRLDLDSNEVNGTATNPNGTAKETVVQATYKKLPDEDTNWQSKNEKEDKILDTTMVKQNGTDPEVEDEAHEKMLQDDVKLTPKKDGIEVKFISENGDAKIDIATVKQVLSGMGKEELMKFANDPFWIKLRWVLFIAFWLLWTAMLAGAVAIIVMAPRCSAPAARKWWQESPIVQLDEIDSPTRNLKGLEITLDPIQKLGIKTISLASIVEKAKDGGVINFRGIQPSLGNTEDLKNFIAAAKSRGQRVIIELDPNHSSVEHAWFKNSVGRHNNQTDFYVWADAKDANGNRKPPNNWLSFYNESAWEWNEQRKQYYLHQFNKTQPDLNYNNPAVVTAFGEILSQWLDLGVMGFRLVNTQFLTEDPTFQNEGMSGGVPESYSSLNHVKTRDRVENGAILREWRKIVLNKTNGEGLFLLADDTSADLLQVFNDKKTGESLIDLPQSSRFLTEADAEISAANLKKGITNVLQISDWPAWDINGRGKSLRQRVGKDVAESLILMTLLLPGTPIVKYRDVTPTIEKAFVAVSEKRKSPAFLHGETKTYVMNNTEIFAYTRLKSGNPGLLVAYNSGNKPAEVNFLSIPHMAEEIQVIAHSSNSTIDGVDVTNMRVNANAVRMPRKSTIVLSFVPEQTK